MSSKKTKQNEQPEASASEVAVISIPTEIRKYRFIEPEQIAFPVPESGDAADDSAVQITICFSEVPVSLLSTLSAEDNARFMTADQMRRLSGNIKKDGGATSAVLVYPDHETKRLIVLSGNHRVEAAVLAGEATMPVMVVQCYLTPERRLALQLSHNAITGQDDPNILGKLYETLTMEYKAYSGLTDDSFNLLEKLNIDSLAIGTPQYEEIVLQFLPQEKEAFVEYLERLGKPNEKKTYLLAAYADYTRLFETIVAVKEFKNVFNNAVAIRELADLAMERLEQLKAEAPAEATKETADNVKETEIHTG